MKPLKSPIDRVAHVKSLKPKRSVKYGLKSEDKKNKSPLWRKRKDGRAFIRKLPRVFEHEFETTIEQKRRTHNLYIDNVMKSDKSTCNHDLWNYYGCRIKDNRTIHSHAMLAQYLFKVCCECNKIIGIVKPKKPIRKFNYKDFGSLKP